MSDTVGERRRGQSELLGIVLLFALVLTVSMTVVVVGSAALSDVQSNTMKESAEVTMIEMQSKAAQSGSNSAAIQEVSFVQSQGARPASDRAVGSGSEAENAGSVSVDGTSGTLTIEITDSNGNVVASPTQIELGKVVYSREGETVAYQGGGVFRKNQDVDSSSVVSPPNFQYQYRNGVPTLSMPVTTVRGSANGDEFRFEQINTDRIFPDRGVGNPINEDYTVKITVQSEYYQAWGSLFEQRTSALPTYDDAANEVTIELGGPDNGLLGGGVVGAISTSEDVVSYNAPNHVNFDSYNSRSGQTATHGARMYIRGNWDSHNHGSISGDLFVEGTVDDIDAGGFADWEISGETIVGQDLHITGKPAFRDDVHVNRDLSVNGDNILIEGDVYVADDVVDLNNVEIQGDLHVGGNLDASRSGTTIGGDVVVGGTHDSSWDSHVNGDEPDDPRPADLPTMDSLSSMISDKEAQYSSSNDNNGIVDDLEEMGNSNRPCRPSEGGPCELSAGNYYFDEGIRLDNGETLKLDTSGGDINIYTAPNSADGHGIYLGSGANIIYTQDNKVRVYNDGSLRNDGGGGQDSGTIQPDSEFEDRAEPSEPDATHFWLYMRPDRTLGYGNNPGAFVGVICAPGSASPRAELTMENHFDVWGAVIADVDDSGNHLNVHFDEAILNENEVCSGNGGNVGGVTANPDGDTVAYLSISATELQVSDG